MLRSLLITRATTAGGIGGLNGFNHAVNHHHFRLIRQQHKYFSPSIASKSICTSWNLSQKAYTRPLTDVCNRTNVATDSNQSISKCNSRSITVHPRLFTDYRFNRILPSLSHYQSSAAFHSSSVYYIEKDSSKVESSVKDLRSEASNKAALNGSTAHAENELTVRKDHSPVVSPANDLQPLPKRSLTKRIWDEIVHYYHGFRLLFIDIKVTSRLVWNVLNGGELSRREHRQLVRTVADLFRLVPFSVFIIVPFMELLLPVFIKFFPGMLPSTFQTASDKESKIKNQLKVKLDMAKFLQNTLDEMALQSKGEAHSHRAKEFAMFFDRIRKSGAQATNEEILKYSKLFEDEITLDTLSRPQLIALCRLLELQPLGTNAFLRFQLKMRLRSLNADDRVIQQEGILNLTVSELQQACRARGMRALGVPEERLRYQLQQWLELSLNEKIPPSLLLLSRALYLPENIPTTDQLKATIQTLPEELGTEAKYKIGEREGKIDNRTKIELIRQEEEAIKKEKEERERERLVDEAAAAAAAAEQPEPETAEQLRLAAIPTDSTGDLDRTLIETIAEERKAKGVELTKEDLDSIEAALDKMSIEKKRMLLEKEELQDLKEEMQDYNEDIEELQQIVRDSQTSTGPEAKQIDLKETKAAKRLRKRVDKMILNLDGVFSNLESKKKDLQEKIDHLVSEGKEADVEQDRLVNVGELLVKIEHLKKIGDEAKLSKIFEVLDMMDVDHDGRVDLDVLVKVLELIGRENVKINSKQMKDIINLVLQEEDWKKRKEQTTIEEKKKELGEEKP